MLLWYVGLSVFLVATIFRSTGIDYRLVAVGSMMPLVVDVPFGYRAYGYTLLFGVSLLGRRLLCLPIGVFCGLVLSGASLSDDLFWWPFLGSSFPHDALPPATWVVVLEEFVGLAVCWLLVGQYDL